MKLTVSEPLEDIFHLKFDSSNEMAEAFLRFQEHYESPEFKGKVFTLDEYKAWYVERSSEGRESGEFTYYDDWGGFNIPSEILEPFYEGKFDPLSEKERVLLDLFRERRGKLFYIIATGRSEKEGKEESSLRHECAHGLFYTRDGYKMEVLSIISSIDMEARSRMDELLASYGGYHPSVFDDEVHAYLVSDADFFKQEGDIEHPSIADVSRRLMVHFESFRKNVSIS